MRDQRERCAHAPHQLATCLILKPLSCHHFGFCSHTSAVGVNPRNPQVATKEEESLPPWIRNERERKLQAEEGSDLPFPVYLIGSALVAIAAVCCLTLCC